MAGQRRGLISGGWMEELSKGRRPITEAGLLEWIYCRPTLRSLITYTSLARHCIWLDRVLSSHWGGIYTNIIPLFRHVYGQRKRAIRRKENMEFWYYYYLLVPQLFKGSHLSVSPSLQVREGIRQCPGCVWTSGQLHNMLHALANRRPSSNLHLSTYIYIFLLFLYIYEMPIMTSSTLIM